MIPSTRFEGRVSKGRASMLCITNVANVEVWTSWSAAGRARVIVDVWSSEAQGRADHSRLDQIANVETLRLRK